MPIQINPATTFSTNINPRSTALAVPSILPPLTATVAFASIDLPINQAISAILPVIATGGNDTYTFAVTPALPAGFNFDTATGQITGTPTILSSTATHTVTVTDSASQTSATFSLTVSLLPALTTTQVIPATTLTQNTADTPFTPVTAAGGFGTLTFAVAPVLPAGLILSTITGQITGTPTETLTATDFTVTVTDGASQTSSKTFSLTVNAAVLTTTTTTTTSVVTLGISAGGTTQSNVSTLTQAITLSASNFTAGKRLIIILAGFRDANGSYVNSRVPLTATATLGGLPLIKVSEGQSDYNSSGVFVGLLDLTGAQNLVLNFNPTTFSGGAGYVAYMIFDDVTYWNYVGGSGGIASATTSLGISAPSGLSELGQTVRIVGLNASNPASAPTFTPSDGFTYTTWFSQDNGTNEWSVGYYYIASSLTSAENAISGTMSGASAPQGFGYATADFKIYRIS